MNLKLSIEPLAVVHTLYQAGYEAYIVGGAVRDLLRASKGIEDRPVTDFDFTTNATPEQIQTLFPDSFYENKFGTVSITPEHLRAQLHLPEPTLQSVPAAPPTRVIDIAKASKIHISLQKSQEETEEPLKQEASTIKPYEITTFRSDGVYSDHRRPETVTWGSSLKEDLDRRDFTINAMAIQINPHFLQVLFSQAAETLPTTIEIAQENYELIDPHHGLSDLENHLLQTVGDPTIRFKEDALRMLRVIRFSVQLNLNINEETFAAISEHAALLEHISFERIRDEFFKMLASPYPKEAVELLDETGLLRFIVPELLDGKGVLQGGHHTTDVWTHSLDALAACPSSDPVVKLATLLHDIAKPQTYADAEGKPTFYNHEIVGSRVAKKIAERLRLSKKDCDRVFTLVRYHMFHYQPEQTDAAIRRFMRKVGLEHIDDILDLREGDRMGSGARKTSWRLEEMKQRMIEQLNQPMDVTDLAIDGTDLMRELGLEPGPIIGKILHELFEQVMDQPELNTREILLEKAKLISG